MGVGARVALQFRRGFYLSPIGGSNSREFMSVIGTKRTSRSHSSMSAFGGKADMDRVNLDVCL
jgi:hypothetical protein